MDSIVAFINDVGATCRQSIEGLIIINYVVAENVVRLIHWVARSLLHIVLGLGHVIRILLEDFGTFLEEVSESIALAVAGLFHGVDALFNALSEGATSLYLGIVRSLQLARDWVTSFVFLAYHFSDLVGKGLSLALSTLLAAVSLIPQMLLSGLTAILNAFRDVLSSTGSLARQAGRAIAEAPLQAVVGFLAASLFAYLSYRTAKRVIVDRHITLSHLARWTVHGLCFLYVLVINFLLLLVRGGARTVEFTLSHLHVARFHHGPMDSDEEEIADPDVIPPEDLGDSDGEANERLEARRRTYDLLVKRRDERRQKRSKSKRQDPPQEVEDLLLEQVEREREDKLCVICQDREKCIMILPCRHLCICQDCQVSLMRRADQHAHSRTCPICRKNVKQTIKAYL
jgi:hypothetical protein